MNSYLKNFFEKLCVSYLKNDYEIIKKYRSSDSLFDNQIHDEYKVLTNKGDVIFQSKSVATLLKENSYIIKAILKEIQADTESYITFIKPIITYFAKLISIAPASLCGHDSNSGGLFRHSLLVSYYLVRDLNECEDKCNAVNPHELKLSKHDFNDRLCLLILGFLHDSAKLLTDYKITTLGQKYTFSFSKYKSIDNFIAEHNALYVRFFFRKQRKNDHESHFNTMLKRFCMENSKLVKVLLTKNKKSAFYNLVNFTKQNALYSLLKIADGQAVTQSLERYDGFSNINTLLLQALATNTIDLNTEGFYKVHFGLIVEAGSLAYQKLIALFDSYYERMEVSKQFNETEFFNKFIEKLEHVKTIQNTTHEAHEYYFENERHLFIDKFLLELLEENTNNSLPRKNFFLENRHKKFFKQVAFTTPYLWYELQKHGTTHLVHGFAIPFFNYVDDIFVIKRNVHVSIVKELFEKLCIYSKDSIVTYFRTYDPYTIDDVLNSDNAANLIDATSIRYNDFKIKREKELSEQSKKRYRYKKWIEKQMKLN